LESRDTINSAACHKIEGGHSYTTGIVSVIIPTYNRADCITRAIDSVLAQKYKNYEIIVVDDGSTDDTRRVLEPYMNRIRYIYQENAGCAAARNTGIRASCGEWIAFLDSDDRWLPEKLEYQMAYLKETGAEVCYTNSYFDFGDETENANKNVKAPSEKTSWLVAEPLDMVTTHNAFHNTLPSMVINKSLLDRIGYFDEWVRWGSDTRFILKVGAESAFAYINKKLVIVDRTKSRERLTKRDSKARKARRTTNVLNYADTYFRCRNQSKKVVKKLRHMLGDYISSLAVSYCRDNCKVDARRFAVDGIYFGRSIRVYARCFAVLLCPWLVRRIRKNH
jgi:glycosyltransferase involved in cell wall biosynthesis